MATSTMRTDLEVNEADERYAIDRMTPFSPDCVRLFDKSVQLYQERSKFWSSRIAVGRKCQRYNKRQIFTDEQKLVYENDLNKIPFEPQVMKPFINSLRQMISRRVNPGTVSMEDAEPPPNVAKPENVQIVLKWLHNKLGLRGMMWDALGDGLLTGFPQLLWFERVLGEDGLSRQLVATLWPWEAALPTPNFEQADGSDIDDVILLGFRTKRQLLDAFPDREEALRRHSEVMSADSDPGHYVSMLAEANDLLARDRADYLANMILQARYDSLNGRYFCIYRAFPVKHKETVWYSEELQDAVRFPPHWEQWRKDLWMEMNPSYDKRITREIKTLWSTMFSSDGFCWLNEKHWYQYNGQIPGTFYVPSLVDRIPTGAGEDMLPYVFAKAVCETEGLDQVRKGTGSVTIATEGALRHPKYLGEELNKANGVVILKKGHTPEQAIKQFERKPNTTFFEYGDRLDAQLEKVHNVRAAMLGAHAERQSDKAKKREIDQSMSPNSTLVENYGRFTYALNTRLCTFFPYALTEQMVVQIDDEFGRKEPAAGPMVVNQTGFNERGEAQIIANDLTSAEYRYVPVPGDDSEMSREEQLREFVEMLASFGNTLLNLNPQYMSEFLKGMPNKFAREAGDFMGKAAQSAQQAQMAKDQAEGQAKVAQQQARTINELMKIITPKVMMKTDATDIEGAPEAFKLFYQMVLAAQEKATQLAMSSPHMQQQQPQMAPQGGPAGPQQQQGAPQMSGAPT